MNKPHLLGAIGESRYIVFSALFTLLFSSCLISAFGLPVKLMISVSHPNDLHDPSQEEVVQFLLNDKTDENTYSDPGYTCYDFALDTVNNARQCGIRCGYVVVRHPNSSSTLAKHAIIAFYTTDAGKMYFEPQSDELVNPKKYEILYEQF